MGDVNSSVTRVWPVFDTLIASDETGDKWLTQLLSLAPMFPHYEVGSLLPDVCKFNRELPRNLKNVLGETRTARLGHLRSCFEVDYPPPQLFLQWLINNAGTLSWPSTGKGDKNETRHYSASTQSKRVRLRESDQAARAEAHRNLEREKAAGSRRKWWAFEGFTSVDCCLETDKLVVFIEGKRTEPISSATDWYPKRNQVVRNVEVASCEAAKRDKNFGVIVCAETPIPLGALGKEAFQVGLPHLLPPEQDALRAHYWGCITWQQIVDTLCPALKLPDDLEAAVKISERLRP
jgi:hypothetical protein